MKVTPRRCFCSCCVGVAEDFYFEHDWDAVVPALRVVLELAPA